MTHTQERRAWQVVIIRYNGLGRKHAAELLQFLTRQSFACTSAFTEEIGDGLQSGRGDMRVGATTWRVIGKRCGIGWSTILSPWCMEQRLPRLLSRLGGRRCCCNREGKGSYWRLRSTGLRRRLCLDKGKSQRNRMLTARLEGGPD